MVEEGRGGRESRQKLREHWAVGSEMCSRLRRRSTPHKQQSAVSNQQSADSSQQSAVSSPQHTGSNTQLSPCTPHP